MIINYYLCVTEYHVLLSILLAKEKFSSVEYKNRIILCNAGRFNDRERYKLATTYNIEYVICDQENVESVCFIQSVLKECNGGLFLYNLNNPQFTYLLYKLKQTKQARTAYVQEGLASYNYRHYTFKRRIGSIKHNFKILRKSGVSSLSFYLYAFGLGGCLGGVFDYYDKVVNSHLVDDFWLSHPESVKYGKNKAIRLPDFSEKSIKAANDFFNYRQTVFLKENDILFIDQEIDGSFAFIKELSETFHTSDIHIKLHPKTNIEWAAEYEKIANVRIINSLKGIPIELLLQNLSHVVVITPFSSALLIDNPGCKYYFVYKWFIKQGYDIGNNNLYVPGEHINEISSVAEIKLY